MGEERGKREEKKVVAATSWRFNLHALSREDRDAKMVIKTPNKTDFGCGRRPQASLEVG